MYDMRPYYLRMLGLCCDIGDLNLAARAPFALVSAPFIVARLIKTFRWHQITLGSAIFAY